jgi:hypothetical protein
MPYHRPAIPPALGDCRKYNPNRMVPDPGASSISLVFIQN